MIDEYAHKLVVIENDLLKKAMKVLQEDRQRLIKERDEFKELYEKLLTK